MSEDIKKENMFNNEAPEEEENSFFLDVEGIEETKETKNVSEIAKEESPKNVEINIEGDTKPQGKKLTKDKKRSLYIGPEQPNKSDEPPLIQFFKNLKNNTNLQSKSALTFFLVSFLILAGIIIQIYIITSNLNKKSDQLRNLSKYNNVNEIAQLHNEFGADKMKDINNIIEEYQSLEQKKEGMMNYMNQLQAPYINFLSYVLLPSQNIWKDPYTEKISTDIIGEEYLKRNPYLDTNLLDKWGSFFKKVSTGLYNEIKDIKITPINEKEGIFDIGITVNFESPDRPAFLMLISKLSSTSNKKNISSINEFLYNIWKVIKEDNYENLSGAVINIQRTEFVNLGKAIGNYKSYSEFSDRYNNKNNIDNIEKLDKLLGELFYRSIMQPIDIFQNNAEKCHGTTVYITGDNLNCSNNDCSLNICFANEFQKIDCKDENLSGDIFYLNWDKRLTVNKENLFATCNNGQLFKVIDEKKLIDNEVILKAIELTANCNKGDITKGNNALARSCFYKFREKFNNLPELAYSIGDEKTENKDKLKILKDFIKDLPPLMNISAFNFQTAEKGIIQEGDYQYKGDVTIKIFGKSITNDDIGKIEKDLGNKCFDKNKGIERITPNIALKEVQNSIKQLTTTGVLESRRTIDLGELEIIIQEINDTYQNLTTYDKAIKLFELYRMLYNIDICNK
ncbi:MAG: hypothetical protein V3575_02815 [Candidatus Absconditabacteria bacterium]